MKPGEDAHLRKDCEHMAEMLDRIKRGCRSGDDGEAVRWLRHLAAVATDAANQIERGMRRDEVTEVGAVRPRDEEADLWRRLLITENTATLRRLLAQRRAEYERRREVRNPDRLGDQGQPCRTD